LVAANPVNPYGSLVQPALAGLNIAEFTPDAALAVPTTRGEADVRRVRRRYWSIRDLSRRLWLGRGYELLRRLIHFGVLPATRSARSWWIRDEDVTGLIVAFEDRAGKVRAFGGLEHWLLERCHVTALTPEMEGLAQATRAVFIWRGRAYLPKAVWQAGSNGVEYRHPSGVTVATEASTPLAA
jgi:hypothetical protein